MGAKRLWWRQIKQHSVRAVLIALLAVFIVLVILGGYQFNWDWTGFNRPSKTLWDWLQLLGVLAVPVVVGFGAVWFTTRQGKAADSENKDNQRETALQAYIDKMSELLLKEHLGERTADGEFKPEYDHVRNIARVRTITILFQLDARRIGYVFAFLRESGLMSTKPSGSIVSLKQANLNKVNFSQADLYKVDLSGSDLRNANLFQAYLNGANLCDALLNNVDLRDAYLSGANLKGAKGITNEELEKQAYSLKGATMPDGSIHE
jgi:hypothetical protein